LRSRSGGERERDVAGVLAAVRADDGDARREPKLVAEVLDEDAATAHELVPTESQETTL
jgi:hypothetical protein